MSAVRSSTVRLLMAATVLAAFVPFSGTAQTLEPVRVTTSELATAPFQSTGLVDIAFGRSYYRGSGIVGRDPRIVLTCAHNVFEEGAWASQIRFARAWNSQSDAPDSSYTAFRGYRYMAGYASAATRYGSSSSQAFANDFAVGFGTSTSNFGPVVASLADGTTPLLQTGNNKMILGYPAELDASGKNGYHYQHKTGPFTSPFTTTLNPYLGINRVATGPGNSGGPVLVNNAGIWQVAGILVSGSSRSAGIFSINAEANQVIADAITAAGGGTSPTPSPTPTPTPTPTPSPGTTLTVSDGAAFNLPDGNTKYSSRVLTIRNAPATTTRVTLSLNITTSYRGDLDVYLRSPSGRTYVIARSDYNDNRQNLVLTNADISASFTGTNPNGKWTLYMRDVYRSDIARYLNASLTVSAR